MGIGLEYVSVPLTCYKRRLNETNDILDSTTKSEPRVTTGVTQGRPLLAQRQSIDLEFEAIFWQR